MPATKSASETDGAPETTPFSCAIASGTDAGSASRSSGCGQHGRICRQRHEALPRLSTPIRQLARVQTMAPRDTHTPHAGPHPLCHDPCLRIIKPPFACSAKARRPTLLGAGIRHAKSTAVARICLAGAACTIAAPERRRAAPASRPMDRGCATASDGGPRPERGGAIHIDRRHMDPRASARQQAFPPRLACHAKALPRPRGGAPTGGGPAWRAPFSADRMADISATSDPTALGRPHLHGRHTQKRCGRR